MRRKSPIRNLCLRKAEKYNLIILNLILIHLMNNLRKYKILNVNFMGLAERSFRSNSASPKKE